MADAQRTIDIIFAGVDKVSGTIDTVSGRMSSFGDSVEAVSAPLANIADSVLKFGAVLTTLAVGGLTYAFMKSKDYESAVIDLEKVMGDQEEVTSELTDTFTNLSRTYGESTIAIINSLAGLRQSGYSTADGLEVLETSLKLARASELSAEEATNLLKRAMIGYNLTASDAITLGDLWNQTSNVSNTTVGKLAEGFAIVSRQAKDSGFSITELSGALTPMIGVFDSGSEAGIAMSMTLTQLLNPTKDGEAAIRALTGATGPLNEEFKSGKDIFEAVAKGLENVDAQTGSVYVAQIVGAQQAKRIKVSFDDYFETLEKIGPASAQYNSLQKEVDKQNASTQASVDRLVAGFESLAVAIGEQFREAAAQAIDGGAKIENALEDIIKQGTFDPIFDALRAFGVEIGKYLKGIALAMPEAFKGVDFSGLLEALSAIGLKLGNLFKDIDLTKPKDLTKVIQFVINSLESLVRVTEGIIGPIGKLIDQVVSWVESFNDLDASSKTAAGEVLGWGKVVNFVIGPLKDMLGAFNGLAIALTAFIAIKAGSSFLSLVAPITAVTASLGPLGLAGAAGTVGAIIGTLARSVFPQIDEGAQKLIGFMDRLLGISDFKSETELKLIDEEYKKAIEDNKARLKEFQDIKIKTEVDAKELQDFIATLKDLPQETQIDLITAFKEGNFEEVDRILAEFASDRTITFDEEKTAANAEKVVAVTTKEIAKIPSEKEIEIRLRGEIDTQIERIKAQAETVQTAMEWSAKIDIAEAEASSKVLVSAFESVGFTIESTGETLVGLFSFMSNLSGREKYLLEAEIKKESERRERALVMQEKMTYAQLAYMEAKTAALEGGQAMITINAAGLEPHLEAFFWAVIEKVRLRVIEEQGDFLLGMT